MNKWIFAIFFGIIIFFAGKFIYDNYGDQIRQKLNFSPVATSSSNITTNTNRSTTQ